MGFLSQTITFCHNVLGRRMYDEWIYYYPRGISYVTLARAQEKRVPFE